MKIIYFSLIISFATLISCFSPSQAVDEIPVHQTFKIQSWKLSEVRTINVWTPNTYETTSDSLPVMYMGDGGIKEDFPHIAKTLAKLIQEKKIKPLILVGIENTQRRRDLTGVTTVAKDKEIAPVVGESAKFRSFINDELFPEINKRFRTTIEKSIIGESLSGLFVVETFFLTPEMFDNYIAFDPSLWWNNHNLITTAKTNFKKFPAAKKRIWFAGSNTEDILPYTKALAAILKKESKTNIQWKFSDEPTEKHETIFRATKEKAIVWTLSKTN